ncbi:MAG: M56 family metallopeptidase [Sedimentisphaerales bacterium]
MTAILNQIAKKWFSWQLSMFWQVGLLIIIIAGLDLLIKKWVWPQVRYALWLLILVKLVLPPTLTSPTSFTAEIPFMVKQTAIKISQPQTSSHAIKPVIVPATEPIPADTTTQPVEIIPAPYTASATPAGAFLSGKTYVFFVWLAGVGILSGWLIIRLSNLRHQHLKDKRSNLPERLEDLLVSTARKLGLKKTPQVILTNKVCCPAVFGIFRPVLLMPADKLQNMTSQDAEHIFLHELAHIKRGDLFVHAVYMILQIVYWFNPLLWLIRKNLQNLRELCCDATVARLLREKTTGYRQTLLETARQLLAEPVDPGLGLLGLFENSSWLVDRLRWLEKKSWKYRLLRITTIFVLVCLMAACVLPMTKFEAPVDFVIKGTVTDAQTGKPIAGAKVGDTEKYADGKFYTTTDANGNYSYKTYYEEHNLKCQAEGYKTKNNILLTKVFGREKEKVINFALEKDGLVTEAMENTKENKAKANFVYTNAASRARKPKLRVLDSQTRKPVANCSFVLGHWGLYKQTNDNGVFDKDEDGFYARLRDCEELTLWHPDYESKFLERNYNRDSSGTVTVLLERSGTASVDVNVALFVRGEKVDNESRKILIFRGEKASGYEVRSAERSTQNRFHFSGLAAGKYMVEVYFYDSHPTHYEPLELGDGEHKNFHINVVTDELARIPLKGKVLDKYTGRGISGAIISSAMTVDDDTRTREDGSFSTISNRASFHETVVYLDYPRVYVLARMKNHMTEELAQQLQFHIDPNSVAKTRNNILEDDNDDGIFCDNANCIMCKNSTIQAEANSVGVGEGIKAEVEKPAGQGEKIEHRKFKIENLWNLHMANKYSLHRRGAG